MGKRGVVLTLVTCEQFDTMMFMMKRWGLLFRSLPVSKASLTNPVLTSAALTEPPIPVGGSAARIRVTSIQKLARIFARSCRCLSLHLAGRTDKHLRETIVILTESSQTVSLE